MAATHLDTGKNLFSATFFDWAPALTASQFALKHIDKWTAISKKSSPLFSHPAKSSVYPMPKGVILNISPYNFPIVLSLSPIVSALAAGNVVLLKPSHLSPHTSALLHHLIPIYLPESVFVILGGPEETQSLLSSFFTFDHIVYTGNSTLAKQVMAFAASTLTPVTLELGGKNPVLVDSTANLKLTANRVIWAKLVNCGQGCMTPDYVLVDNSCKSGFLRELVQALRVHHGLDPRKSADYERIRNRNVYNRLEELIRPDIHKGWILAGGINSHHPESHIDASTMPSTLHQEKIRVQLESDRAQGYFPPTIIVDPDVESPLMAQEIFGPVLVVIGVSSMREAMAFVKRRPRPLAMYVFTNDSGLKEKIEMQTWSGTLCFNI